MAADTFVEERAAAAPQADVTPPTFTARSSVTTLDLHAGDRIEVKNSGHLMDGPAVVEAVSYKPSPSGSYYVSTNRGTFLAAGDHCHTLLGPELPVSSCDGEEVPAAPASPSAAKDPRSAAMFSRAAARCGYDLNCEADAAVARHDHHVWDLVWAEHEAGR